MTGQFEVMSIPSAFKSALDILDSFVEIIQKGLNETEII
jgi:hypothetical protein